VRSIPTYSVRKLGECVGSPTPDDPVWNTAYTLEIVHFRPESSSHRPKTQARLLYDERGIHGLFRVQDQYVLCRRTNYGDEVWKDSCVEFFVRPSEDRGYLNFEFNCGGAFLCSYITNWERTPTGLKEFSRIPACEAAQVRVRPSARGRIDPECVTAMVWTLGFFIPFGLIEKFVGSIGDPQGQIWRANFYKCVEENSHPHWAAWSPVDELNFHLPACFGTIQFE